MERYEPEAVGGEDGHVVSDVYGVTRYNKGFGDRARNFNGIPHVEAFEECHPNLRGQALRHGGAQAFRVLCVTLR